VSSARRCFKGCCLSVAAAAILISWNTAGAQIEPFDEDVDLFLRGDSNNDSTLEMADAIHALGFLFFDTEEPGCHKAADTNDDGFLDIADPISLLQFLFVGGPSPESPFGSCGIDLIEDSLTCLSTPFCNLENVQYGDYNVDDQGFNCIPGTHCERFIATPVDGSPAIRLARVNVCYVAPSTGDKNLELNWVLHTGSNTIGFIQVGPEPFNQTLVALRVNGPVIQLPDLTVPTFETRGDLTEVPGGYDLPVRAVLANQGKIPTTSFDLAFRSGADPIITHKTVRITVPINPGVNRVVLPVIHFSPGSAYLGRIIWLTAVADSGEEVVEELEHNNVSEVILVRFPMVIGG